MPFAEDLSVFLSAAEFAHTATFTPTSGSAADVQVIFDEAYFTQLGMAGTNPMAQGRAADFPATTSVGGTLLIGAVTFTISEREPVDDGAMVNLQLRR